MKKNKKKIKFDNGVFIVLAKLYLFPIYIIGILLKFYDFLKIKVIDFVKYKILKRKKEQKVEDWWIS